MPSDDAKAILQTLAPIEGMIEAVRGALSAPASLMNNTTWRGSAADAWRGDWDGRRKAIESFLDDAQAECNRLRRQLQQK
jgi:hypothetical protein